MSVTHAIDFSKFERLDIPLRDIPPHAPGALSKFRETKSLFDVGCQRERLQDGTEVAVLGNLYRDGDPVTKLLLVERSADKVILLMAEKEFERLRDPREVNRINAESEDLVSRLNAEFSQGRLPVV